MTVDERIRAAATSLRRVVEAAPPIEMPSPVRPRRPWWPFVVLGVAAAIAALVTAITADDAGPTPVPPPVTTTATPGTTTTITTTTVAPAPGAARLTLRGPGLPGGAAEVVLESAIDSTGSFAFPPVELELEGPYEITVAAPRGTATRTVPVVAGESFMENAPAAPTKTEPVTLAASVTALANTSPITIQGRTLVPEPVVTEPPPSAPDTRGERPRPDQPAASSPDGLSTIEVVWGVVLFVGLALFGLGGGLALSAASPLRRE